MSVPTAAELGIDLEHWPVVVVTISQDLRGEQLGKWVDAFEHHVLTRDEPYATVLDLTGGATPTPQERKQIADRMGGQDDHQKLCKAGAFVIESPLLRGALTAVLWLRKPAYPTRVFSSREEAVSWCTSVMQPNLAAPMAQAVGAPDVPTENVERRLEKLQRLHERGVITEAEYQAQRKQALDDL